MKPLVYVAGPYRSNPTCGTRKAGMVGMKLWEQLGVVPIVPHLSMLLDIMEPQDEQYWLDFTMDQMRRCDAVFRLPGQSAGSDAEVAEAERLGIPVLHMVADLLEWVQKWKARAEPSPPSVPATPESSPLPTDPAERKAIPLCAGVLDYFPDALVAVAECSRAGNEQHNPGEPLHWARDKSFDHPDCIMRHLMERGRRDSDGLRHSAKLAWRALALLQLEIEAERKHPKQALQPGD